MRTQFRNDHRFRPHLLGHASILLERREFAAGFVKLNLTNVQAQSTSRTFFDFSDASGWVNSNGANGAYAESEISETRVINPNQSIFSEQGGSVSTSVSDSTGVIFATANHSHLDFIRSEAPAGVVNTVGRWNPNTRTQARTVSPLSWQIDGNGSPTVTVHVQVTAQYNETLDTQRFFSTPSLSFTSTLVNMTVGTNGLSVVDSQSGVELFDDPLFYEGATHIYNFDTQVPAGTQLTMSYNSVLLSGVDVDGIPTPTFADGDFIEMPGFSWGVQFTVTT